MAQAALNAMLAAITATVPDQVPDPPAWRASVAGWRSPRPSAWSPGRASPTATGSIAAGYLTDGRWRWSCCSLPVPASTAATSPLAPEDREPFDLGRFVRSFWVSPRAAPRLRVGLDHPVPDEPRQRAGDPLPPLLPQGRGRPHRRARPSTASSLLTAVYGVCTVLTAVVGGIWSDRLGRRKVFVIASGPGRRRPPCSCSPSSPPGPAPFVGAVILGIGFGIYTAVDFAMITQVLPIGRGPRQGPRRHQHRQRPAPGARPRRRGRSCSASASATRPSTSSPPASACSARCWW